MKQMDEVNILCDQCGAPAAIRKETERILEILDNVYGDLRDVQKDDGGYILLSTEPLPEIQLKNILKQYHVRSKDFEYEDFIYNPTGVVWIIRLYIITNDYGITIIFPREV